MFPHRETVHPLEHLAAHWKVIAGVCAVAVLVALGMTLLMPRKYTATSRLFIEPPAGDPRAAIGVSPVYLDSLRTYEALPAGDTLFQTAVERFGLRDGSQPVDRLKKAVLKTSVPRNTRILEINVTTRDPKKSQQVALYLAEETVKMAANLGAQADRDLASEAEKQVAAARARLSEAQRAWANAPDQSAVETLRASLEANTDLRRELDRQLAAIEFGSPDPALEPALEKDRMAAIRQRLRSLEVEATLKRKALADGSARLEQLDAELNQARRAASAAESKLQEIRTGAGNRGERLRLVDPGVVPERPSSPDLVLNLVIAFIAGATLAVGGVLLLARGAEPDRENKTQSRWLAMRK